PCGAMVGSSPRFDMYGCDFGWGRPAAVRSGKANKMDGRASLYPGREGGGSMDAEVTLTPEHKAALEGNEEFWAAVTPEKKA
uniref:Acetyltransferase n=1 Tax=Aegilops tauschii subsp. strangulata TaxID=200361 RepID=A0A453Q9F0_AEGTS